MLWLFVFFLYKWLPLSLLPHDSIWNQAQKENVFMLNAHTCVYQRGLQNRQGSIKAALWNLKQTSQPLSYPFIQEEEYWGKCPIVNIVTQTILLRMTDCDWSFTPGLKKFSGGWLEGCYLNFAHVLLLSKAQHGSSTSFSRWPTMGAVHDLVNNSNLQNANLEAAGKDFATHLL